jgi:uncharacterized repeat protein (TIGR01451 family)
MILEWYREKRVARLARRLLTALLLAALGTGAASALVWTTESVEWGHMGGPADLALDSTGNPGISYHDTIRGGYRYAWRDASGWHSEPVDTDTSYYAHYSSLALTDDDSPRIAYWDSTNFDLKYAWKDGTGWHTQTVDEAGTVGAYASLALDADDYPRIAYFNGTDHRLKYAWQDASGWHNETVEPVWYGGQYCSLALDGAGSPRIAYHAAGGQDLMYAWQDGDGWRIETVDAEGYIGQYASLVLDGDDNPRIAYSNGSPINDLKYAWRDGTGWQTETADAAGNVGSDACLALDAAGDPRITYFDMTHQNQKYARRDRDGAWHNRTVGAVVGGLAGSLALDGAGSPRICYWNYGLKYVRADPAPAIEVTVEVSGDFGNTWQDADAAPGPYLQRLPMVPQFRYTITNTGDVSLLSCAIAGVKEFGPLNPGMSRTEQRTGTWAAGQQFVEATATGTYDGQPVSDTDRAYYFGAAPAIAIEALTNGVDADTPPGPTVVAGSTVTWTYIVTNIGNVALTDVAVTDDKGVTVTAPTTALSPGESMTATASGTAVPGQYANIGTATATWSDGLVVSASDPSHYLGLRPPVASFTADPAAGVAPLTVRFTNTSTGEAITGLSWDFENDGTPDSAEQNPVHTYTAAGTYTVNLTVANIAGSTGTTRTVNVAPRPWISADFAANVTSGPAPLAVQFTDCSTGGVSYRAWEFGDGTTSTETNPVHIFTTAGTYTVSLLVSNFETTDRHTQTLTVTGTSAPLATLPGGAGMPADLDGDGLCEDVNGNGRADFADVVLFFNQLSWIASNEPLEGFDYNGNGRIDFADVVWLFNNL